MMNYTLKIITILLFCTTSAFSQDISPADSIEIRALNKELFNAIDLIDRKAVSEISTEKIYCIICFNATDVSDSEYLIDKDEFINKHLLTIKDSEYFKRAKMRGRVNLISEQAGRITALWTIYKPNEMAPGHEGGQLGVHFKQVNGNYKFSGIETIP